MRSLGLALIALALVLASASAQPVIADSSGADGYRQAVSDTLTIVVSAEPGDTTAAQHASQVLSAGTGESQPEVLQDLRLKPPAFKDAANRLRAVLTAIDTPATTVDPGLAQKRLHDVMSMSRYDALHRPPSLFDRILQWIRDRIGDLLTAMARGIGPGGVVPTWVVYAIALMILTAVVVVVFRASRGRMGGGFEAGVLTGPQAPADYFAEADRLAAKGDRVGAIRALCAGVAGTLAGERTWEGSPLTVREIFRRAPDPATLDSLLRPFEAAVYGDREVDEVTYERAAAVAARFRTPAAEAAA